MEKFVDLPNLPAGRVSHVIMSDFLSDAVSELRNNYHISVTVPEPIPEITGSERFHADMGVCHLGKEKFLIEGSNAPVKKMLNDMNAEYETVIGITAAYPLLNACINGNTIICNTKKIDKRIIDHAVSNRMKILHTNQSYTKCSVAIISENAIITADKGIASLCRNESTDVLLIKEGSIELKGYPYGFIGGCCGKLSPDIIAFSGKIKDHPDYDNIRAFSESHNVNIISLSNKPLYDVGGILPVCEQ